jgi:sterol desaturase/sphingolipid hydroxylase (fatty acid hydroxylase superfamily)
MANPRSPRTSGGALRSWAAAFGRLAPDRVAIVPGVTLAVEDASKPRPGQPRMFDISFIEWFTRVHPATLLAIYLPVIGFLLWEGAAAGVSVAAAGALFVIGALGWTLLEYLLHRFSFHLVPWSRRSVAYVYMIHGVHHAFDEDRGRWVMPPVVSLPVSAALYVLLRLAIGDLHGPVLAGSIAAYLWYDLLHYSIHRGPMRWKALNALRKHHLQHHYATPDSKFGVSTVFWDRVFGTLH